MIANNRWNKSYPYLVWLSTLALGPIICLGTQYNENNASPLGIAAVLAYFFFFGILISAPAFFIFLLLFQYLLRDRLSPIITKSLSCLTAIVSLIATLYAFGYRNFHEHDVRQFVLSYAIIIALSSFIFKIKRTTH